jgi:NAD(P)H-nitrite reductase large subunit
MRTTRHEHQPVFGAEEIVVCRCEEIASAEIADAIAAGARTVDDVKRRTRAGMGLCQGIYCMPYIAATMAQATGTAIERIAPMTARPPVRPIPLEALADLGESDEDGDGQQEREEGRS